MEAEEEEKEEEEEEGVEGVEGVEGLETPAAESRVSSSELDLLVGCA